MVAFANDYATMSRYEDVFQLNPYTQFADAIANRLSSLPPCSGQTNPVYEDDHLWDSTPVGRWETLAKTLPPIVTCGSIVVERGKPHFKGPPLVDCPRCKTKLTRGTATLTYRQAPPATREQAVEAWVCSCGEFYVPGEIAREGYLRAFQRSPIKRTFEYGKTPEGADDDELEELRQTLLRWAGKAKGLPADLARNHDHYLHGRPKK